MSPSTRQNSALAQKIATLQLRLAPLVPLPSGPPHPSFPQTLITFHLLTEDELDSIAHYYHQSTPGQWTYHYPATMNWDKEHLAKPDVVVPSSPTSSSSSLSSSKSHLQRRQQKSEKLSQEEDIWLEDLMNTVEDLQSPILPSSQNGEEEGGGIASYRGLSDKERIRIKRRKVGKFIGLVGMETPVEEIAGRIQASLERAVERSREEFRRNEEVILRRRKMA